ncbi:MAG: SGNH/GDSL hydrolase family protein [Pelagimonas sp.]|jgi:lysophospholipase L1-like esterase|nr:SGNH/GDSL hydrolase family protein [Pelagimonas sp.]
MTYPHGGAGEIWRDGVGQPHNPSKFEIREWGGHVEDQIDAAQAAVTDLQEAVGTNAGALDQVREIALENQAGLRDLSALPANGAPLYADVAAGLAATSDGDYFNVPSDDPMVSVSLYKNTAGSAVLEKEAPSAEAFEDIPRIKYFLGAPDDKVGPLASGYIRKSDGTEAANINWRRSDLIAVDSETVLVSTAAPVGSGSGGCNFAFYGATQQYVGFHNLTAPGQEVLVGSVSPSAAYVRAMDPTSAGFELTVEKKIVPTSVVGLDELMGAVVPVDYFETAQTNGYIHKDTGKVVPSQNWLTTAMVPVVPGQGFIYTGAGSDALVASIAQYDAAGNYLGALVSQNNVYAEKYTVTDLNVAYVRASAALTLPRRFLGAAARSDVQPLALAPAVAYALKDEPLYLYARGICADRNYDLVWNLPSTSERVARVTPSEAGAIPVTLTAYGSDGFAHHVAEFDIQVADTPVNPASARNVICLGDSLTEGVSQAGVQGAYVNELSRRLRGVGTELLNGDQSPPPLALSNMVFRGTRGDQAVLHEGRGGWDANRYLSASEVGGVSNAFWNPAANGGAGGFDLAHYLSENGFDLLGDVVNGVDATGSNLTVVILLGWNDVYGDGVEQSSSDLADLIDAIHATHPATDIIVLGLNPAPRVNFKNFTGERLVSERRVFEDVVRTFGLAYQGVCEAKANAEFLQISHVFDPETAYATTQTPLSARVSETITGALDHVHPAATGYAQIADAVFYRLIGKYCQ